MDSIKKMRNDLHCTGETFGVLYAILVTTVQKVEILERVKRKATRMINELKVKLYDKDLMDLGMSGLSKRSIMGGHDKCVPLLGGLLQRED